MKFIISLFTMIYLLSALGIQAHDIYITGPGTMYEMIWITGDEVNKTTEDQMKDEGMTSEYFFLPEGKLNLVSNMTGFGVLETLEGAWKLDVDKLTCSFILEGNPVDTTWDFEFKDDAIHLKRTFADGSTSVVNSFKRK